MTPNLESELKSDFLPKVNKTSEDTLSFKMLNWSSIFLVITVWLSSMLFGFYILTFYAGAIFSGTMQKWNEVLPGLHDVNSPAATIGIGIHFAAGGMILILGFIQLIEAIRNRFPTFHRIVGRIYVAASILAGIGGLLFIVLNGTIGGIVMDIGFSLYGILMIICAVQTIRFARLGELETHRAWALRLFALAIGSWLYRMDYGFWILLTNGLGHEQNFRGLFDMIMAFFFYLPNLLIVEIYIRGRHPLASSILKLVSAAILLGASGFLLLGTYFFTKYYWGPAILNRLIG